MKILLDTHTLLWMALKANHLSQNAKERINSDRTTDILMSSFSIWEICKLVQKKKIFLQEPVEQWLNSLLKNSRISVIDIDAKIAFEACHLPGNFHSDPADQIIVATARIHGATLITKDQKILNYPHVKSEW